MNKWLFAVAATLLAFVGSSAKAGTLTFLEPAEGSSTWTVIVAGIPSNGGPGQNGTFTFDPIQNVNVTGETILFSYFPNRVPTQTTTVVAGLFDDPQLSVVSDVLRYTTTAGSQDPIVFNVTSDTEGAPIAIPSDITLRLLETGQPQLVGVIAYDGSTDQVFLQSDVEVPEPGTLALLGMGLLSMAGYGQRRRKAATA